jgi:N-acyl-L-homoserine lactone synthetase
MKNTFEKISDKFYIKFCDDEVSTNDSMKIRYLVYCEEKSFEPLNDLGIEIDKYDSSSCHFVAYEQESKKAVATFRLITSSQLPVDNSLKKFSIDKVIGKSFEVSRIAILHDMRGKNSGMLSIGLFYSAIYASWLLGARTIYIEVENSLAKSVNRAGIELTKISPFFNHNGQRAIFTVDVNNSLFRNFKDESTADVVESYNKLGDFNITY